MELHKHCSGVAGLNGLNTIRFMRSLSLGNLYHIHIDLVGKSVMESRVLYKGPPDWEGYGTLKCTDVTYAITEAVGSGLLVGTGIGFYFNFIKANTCDFNSRLCNALVKAPCIGGNFALASLGHCLSRNAYFKFSGQTPQGDPIPYEIHCLAIGGAFGFARYGLRAASLAALTIPGVPACDIFLDVHTRRYGSSICKTNTYSYPHYRPPPHDIPWPEALLYDSKLPED